LRRENERLTEELESPSLMRVVQGAAADVGLTFGWIGVYFTLFTMFWNGYTPGKRLMGIRVRRLDGKPFTLWSSFERFGGYAAGVATGLLGFAQVFWDSNRQAIHDKISGTVVVNERDAAAALKGALSSEGSAPLSDIGEAIEESAPEFTPETVTAPEIAALAESGDDRPTEAPESAPSEETEPDEVSECASDDDESDCSPVDSSSIPVDSESAGEAGQEDQRETALEDERVREQ
ncbi:MAG: RDD family protein, partial [Myxococcota bacterium]